MAADEELVFAQHFPFSSTAKNVLKRLDTDLKNLSEEVVQQAIAMIETAVKEEHPKLHRIQSKELLQEQIIRYPIAKIILSLLNDTELNQKFASLVAKNTVVYLEAEKNKREALLNLASDLQLKFDLVDSKDFFVSVPLTDFLQASSKNENLKLVNQRAENGNVFLNERRFSLFISENVFRNILQSLPIQTKEAPLELKNAAKNLKEKLLRKRKRMVFEFSGKINPNFFPACMSNLYNQLLEGKPLQHSARFAIATFLAGIKMPEQQIVSLFSKQPNFKEKITIYQVKRIFDVGYTAAACGKMKQQGLCTSEDCNVKHPLSYYRKQLWKEKKAKQQVFKQQ